MDVNLAMRADGRAMSHALVAPIHTNDEIPDAPEELLYTKGGALMAMFERWLTPDVFQRGVRTFLARRRFDTGSSDDLLAALDAAAGRDVATPFRSFLTQAGYPHVEA